MAQFRPADHSKGDANTLGGYMAVHDRPAAFDGPDGFSYSVDILTDAADDPDAPAGAYLLFVKWARVGAQTPEGHLESEILVTAPTEEDARRRLGAMPLGEVRRTLDALVATRAAESGRPARRWWDVMREDE